ncbi:MAG: hypothetical protein EXS24_02330 [Pedosphaera sp.]|nr:hypothetical protein [Pedosphaera sp.]
MISKLPLALALFLLAGCQKEQIKVYTVPRERKAELPGHWQQVTAGQMQRLRYLVTESDLKAELTVTAFPGEAGGLLANVNRWRKQVGLEPVEADQLQSMVSPIETVGANAKLVVMTGTNAEDKRPVRLIAAIVPRGGMTWFYKMNGDVALVEREQEALLKVIPDLR